MPRWTHSILLTHPFESESNHELSRKNHRSPRRRRGDRHPLNQSTADAPLGQRQLQHLRPTPYDYHQGPGWPCINRSYAGINWHNRTAHIQGAVTADVDLWSTTTVNFQAFAGNKLVESTSRRSERGSVPFNFPIGDSTLPGGIDLTKVQVCHVRLPTDPAGKCTIQYNLWRRLTLPLRPKRNIPHGGPRQTRTGNSRTWSSPARAPAPGDARIKSVVAFPAPRPERLRVVPHHPHALHHRNHPVAMDVPANNRPPAATSSGRGRAA